MEIESVLIKSAPDPVTPIVAPPETPAFPLQSKPAFYRILGDSGRLKTVCFICLHTSETSTYYARGAVVCGKNDFWRSFSQKNGDGIALQRAQKVLEWFKGVGYSFEAYQNQYGNRDHFGPDKHPIHADKLQLLPAGHSILGTELSLVERCSEL